MQRPLLSICIPTYNRARYLPECLDSIVSQLNNSFNKEVEIVIADNASTDNTAEVVATYENKFPTLQLVYFRNDTNLGFDRSFTKLIEKSTGAYCFSLGDDDALFEGAIATIFKAIKENPSIPFFGLNCWGYDSDLKYQVLNHPNLDISNDQKYASLSTYIHSIKRYTNLVGIFVGLSTQLFMRDPWIAFPHKEKFFDTLAVHMYVNLSVFKDSSFMLLSTPVVKTRSSNIRWDVFAGLETIQGRIKSTIQIARWIRKTFNLPIPLLKLFLYFYIREYWFTFKELVKIFLARIGLQQLIVYYRKIR